MHRYGMLSGQQVRAATGNQCSQLREDAIRASGGFCKKQNNNKKNTLQKFL